ncbi:MAG TPA: cell division protein FtsK [Clostridiales bacterium]|nr:cell division protein FtsK [Clostridiales bacterium]
MYRTEPIAETPAYRPAPTETPVTPVTEKKEDPTFRPYSTEDAFRTVIGKAEPSVDKEPEPEEEPVGDPLRIERSVVPPFDAEEEEEDEVLTPEEEPEEDEPSDEEIPPEERNPKVEEYRNRFSFLDEEDEDAKEDSDAPEASDESEEDDASAPADEATADDAEDEESDDEEDDAPPFDGGRQISSRFTEYMNQMKQSEKQAKAPAEEKPAYVPPDYSDYKFPPVDFLLRGENTEGDTEEIQENAEKLIDTLASFKVTASIKGVDRGPRITRYEVVPARGVKVSAVTNLVDDISLAIAAEGIRMEAPIPGKSAIGFEIPNRKPQTVRLRDLIETEDFALASSKTTACIGKDVTGNPVFGDIAKMPHILVAGATGMGKSVCINAILISILYKARPDEVKFIMVDPKKVEFNNYNGIPHLLIPVVTESKQAAGALMWAVEEMEKRYELIEALRVKKIDDYNEKVKADPSLGTPMPKIIIIIDELNDLMVQVRDPVENLIMRLAQKARAAGIHLIIGTQRPSVNVLTGVIKANIPSRMTCKVSSNVDSRTILEQGGAEKLLNNGDMLYWPVGKPKPLRVQGAFVTDGELERIMDYLKAQSKGNTYDESVLEEINRAAQKCSKKKDSMNDDDDGGDGESGDGVGYLNDPTFLDIVELALNSGRIATSFIQRKMSIGYGRASKYIDIMEELGIVGEANGSKPRDVLITKDEWHEMLARRSLDE